MPSIARSSATSSPAARATSIASWAASTASSWRDSSISSLTTLASSVARTLLGSVGQQLERPAPRLGGVGGAALAELVAGEVLEQLRGAHRVVVAELVQRGAQVGLGARRLVLLPVVSAAARSSATWSRPASSSALATRSQSCSAREYSAAASPLACTASAASAARTLAASAFGWSPDAR